MIMLSRLRISINKYINTYLLLLDRDFQTKAYRVIIKGKMQDRFNLKKLKRAVKNIIIK